MKKILLFIVKWLIIFWVASVVSFGVGRLMPGSPAQLLLQAYDLPETPENIEMIERQWGLDEPLIKQYGAWMKNFLRGDWGRSMISKLEIRKLFLKKLPYSLILGFGSILISSLFAFFMGFAAAIRPGGLADKLSRGLAVFAQTVPSSILAVLTIYLIGVKLKAVKFFTGGSTAGVVAATLFLSLYAMGGLARIVRIHFREQMGKPHIRFAIARGFESNYALLRYGSRPVLYGLVSVLIPKFGWILGGSSVMEFIFTIPGISYFLVDSIRLRDYYVIQSYIMVVVIWMFAINCISNLIMNVLDGREGV